MTLPAALNQKAKAILLREFGPLDFARFFQQYETGTGDYTADRHAWLGQPTVSELQAEATQLAAAGLRPRLPQAMVQGEPSPP